MRHHRLATLRLVADDRRAVVGWVPGSGIEYRVGSEIGFDVDS